MLPHHKICYDHIVDNLRMDRLHYGQNIEKSLNRKIYCHSIEEHPKISKIAKFGGKPL